MSRRLLLKSTLRDSFTEQYINKFEGFVFEAEEFKEFTTLAEKCYELLPPGLTDSCIISSLFAQYLKANTSFFPVVISGELLYNKDSLFSCTRPLPGSAKAVIPSDWKESHFWVECGGIIADLSLFRRIYSAQLPANINQELQHRFGPGRGAIIAAVENLQSYGFDFLPQYSLSNKQVEEVAANIEQII